MRPILFLVYLFFPLLAFPQVEVHHKRLKVQQSFKLDHRLPEGSGLEAWNGRLWAHNDSGASMLFAIDTVNGNIIEEFRLKSTVNKDWEDLTQDSLYFYLGDTGNNAGKRDLLNILRIEKQSLIRHAAKIDTIAFSWPEVRDGEKMSKINFDCEAFIIMEDSLYLFTKEYKENRGTRVFSIPAVPGKYVAHYKNKLETNVLVTGATFDKKKKKLVLCGYNLWLRPFLLVFDDVDSKNLFCCDYTRIKLRLRFRQIEGIASFDGLNYYLISEAFHFWFFHRRPALHRADIRSAD